MKQSIAAGIAMLLLVSASAQTTTPPQRKAKKPAVVSKPVSGYMRRIGLLYLETVADYEKACSFEARKGGSCDTDQWDETFQRLEDRVDITLSESRSTGDPLLWRLLKNAKTSTQIFSSSEYLCFMDKSFSKDDNENRKIPACRNMNALLEVYPVCESYAHAIAVNGMWGTDGDGGCSAKLGRVVEATNGR